MVVMVHDALPNLCLCRTDARSHGGYDATGLMPGNNWLSPTTNADGRGATFGSIRVQVAPTHARGFDFEHHLAWTRSGVWKLSQFQLPLTKKHHAAHSFLLLSCTKAISSCVFVTLRLMALSTRG
jgi:hypothetical protein